MTTPATRLPIDVSVASAARRTWWRGGWPPLIVALGGATWYAVLFVLPYYVNGLDAYPLQEVAMGYHDPKDLWPYDQGAAWTFLRAAGLMTVPLGPAAALATLAWAVVRTGQGIGDGDVRLTAPALVAAAIAVGTLGWLVSPFGRALTSWFLD